MIIACDFDGTIVEHKYPDIGPLIIDHVTGKTSKYYINKLYSDGHKIIIWTCRYLVKDIELMKEFLEENSIFYHKINENIDGLSFKPYPKIYADVYIDDRQITGLPSWNIIYNYIRMMSRYNNGNN